MECFEHLCELREPDQIKWLAQHRAQEAQLVARLEKLLQQDRRMQGVADPVAMIWDAPRLETMAPGTRLGAFELQACIGRGGMGDVYKALRSDSHVQQNVAIKVLQASAATLHFLERARLEAQILAQMEHPGIARFISDGLTADDLPYYVMEYVDGVPIDQFCRERQLGLKARLYLFLEICHAVSYANAKLVVHRDIKPSNILVTSESIPKLLDFGIAKIVGAQWGVIPEQTSTAQRIFSPICAAPEQICGEAIGVACDVYGLGCLLYLLLTDQQPFQQEGITAGKLEHLILNVPPTPPSRINARAKSAISAAEVLGDLDLIVAKALRKEPLARYRSAELLAGDILAYLNNRPIAARENETWYVARKFLGRHKLATAAGAIALTAIFATSATVWRSRELAVEMAINNANERDKSQAIADFFRDAMRLAAPDASGAKWNPQDWLRAAALEIPKKTNLSADIRAEVLLSLAESEYQFAMTAQALAHASELENAFKPDTESFWRALLLKVRTNTDLGNYVTAKLQTDYALTLCNSNRRCLALALERNRLLLKTGDRVAASTSLTQDYLLASQQLGEDDPLTIEFIQLRQETAILQFDKKAALQFAQQVLKLKSIKIPPDHPELALVILNIGTLLAQTGDLNKGTEYVKRAITITERSYGAHSVRLISCLNILSNIATQKRELDDSEKLLRRAIAIAEENYSSTHPIFGNLYLNLGVVEELRENLSGAVNLYRQAVALGIETLGIEHPSTLNYRLSLIRALNKSGEITETMVLLPDVIKAFASRKSKGIRLAQANAEYAFCYWSKGDKHTAFNLMQTPRIIFAQYPEEADARWGYLSKLITNQLQ